MRFRHFFKNKNSGFSLLELVVGAGLFVMVMLSAVSIFQLVTEGQRKAMAAENIQTNIRFALEVMSREMRNAIKDDNNKCDDITNKNRVYSVNASNTELYFKNQYGECLKYYLSGERLKIKNVNPGQQSKNYDDFVTPDEIKVSNLQFSVSDNNSGGQNQPRLTMRLTVEAKGKDLYKQALDLQTTVSARYYLDLK